MRLDSFGEPRHKSEEGSPLGYLGLEEGWVGGGVVSPPGLPGFFNVGVMSDADTMVK